MVCGASPHELPGFSEDLARKYSLKSINMTHTNKRRRMRNMREKRAKRIENVCFRRALNHLFISEPGL